MQNELEFKISSHVLKYIFFDNLFIHFIFCRLLKRIQEVPPAYNHIKWEEDAKAAREIMKNMTLYPEFLELRFFMPYIYIYIYIYDSTLNIKNNPTLI